MIVNMTNKCLMEVVQGKTQSAMWEGLKECLWALLRHVQIKKPLLSTWHDCHPLFLLPSSWVQKALACALQFDAHFSKIEWIHHPLLLDPNGNKLSKTAGSLSLSKLRTSQTQHDF